MLNKVMLIGNLGKDPELKKINDKDMCKFSLATSERFKDKGGEWQEHTTWHNIAVWDGQARACGEHLSKGRAVCVLGRISNREYEQDGVKKFYTEIVAERVVFLGGGKKSGGGEVSGPSTTTSGSDGEDLPF